MSKVFSGPPASFAAGGDGTSPYARQLAAMEGRFLGTRREIEGWRRIALIVASIAAASTIGSLYLAVSKPTAVHVVEIDGRTGEPFGRVMIRGAAGIPRRAPALTRSIARRSRRKL
jgi:hypothetical protein